jgi:hypothetical protein
MDRAIDRRTGQYWHSGNGENTGIKLRFSNFKEMNKGFIIKQLTLTGPQVRPATVTFEKGLNIISGPSNTGKTYIFQCINYMFGGSKPPKAIKESTGYLNCYLQLENSNGNTYTLKSDLKGGDFHLFQSDIVQSFNSNDYQNLDRKHDGDKKNSVSQFLLSLCNIENIKLKKNDKGQKRSLSFRDLVKLTLIDEKKIITDESPIITGEYTTATVEKSLFKFLLTGIDDSALIEKISEKEVTHRKGKLELLNELIAAIDADIANLGIIEYENDRLQKVESGILSLNNELSSLDEVNRNLTMERSAQYVALSAFRGDHAELEALLGRSEILSQQYDSDAARLKSTIEACMLLGHEEFSVTECPFCHQNFQEDFSNQDAENILRACQVELSKIDQLKRELISSQAIIKTDLSTLRNQINITQASIVQIDFEIQQKVQNKIKTIVDNLEELQSIKDQLKRHNSLISRRKTLDQSRQLIASSIPSKKRGGIIADNLSSIISPLTKIMQGILKECNYSSEPTVSFNEGKLDFIISGEDRELTGKGYRAITYSAFIVALQNLMVSKTYSIGPCILDSPFVTYRKPDAGEEGISIDLAMDFYRHLANNDVNQVLILENEEPPTDINNIVHHIVFTQSLTVGRYGFIPNS